MKKTHKILSMRLVKLLNLAAMAAVFSLLWLRQNAPLLSEEIRLPEGTAVIALFVGLYLVFVRVYEAFLISQSRISELVGSQFLSALLTDLFLYVVTCLLVHGMAAVWPFLAALFLQGLVAVVWTYVAHQWYFRRYPPQPTAVFYEDEQVARAFVREYDLRKRYHLIRAVHVSDSDETLSWLDGIEVVFLAGVSSRDRDPVLKHAAEHGLELYIVPRIGDLIMAGATKVHMFHYPALRVGRYSPRVEYLVVKRFGDILISLLALVVLSPLMLVTAALIYAHDKGPVFYKQERLTKNGKRFRLLKFRSMRVDAENDGVARLSSGKYDPRVTPVGRVIRKYRIDELPQLLNILKGDLALVGPRPERPEIAAQYEQSLPEFRLRLQAKAGLTGYAQVYGKYNTDPYHKLQMDLMYIANPSLLEDLLICIATMKVLFQPESTEGVRADQTTAMEEAETAAVGAE